MPFADLQLHSNASDGSDTPAEVVRRAHYLGFAAIALTDHDTMAGVREAGKAASDFGMELIPACELSTLDTEERQIDLLAYGVSAEDEEFAALLASIRGSRLGRAQLMVEKLNSFGFDVSWERVCAIAGSENVGRPHVARAMVEAGIVPDVKSAFTPEFILDGGRCYVQRVRISPNEAIERVHKAGGVAVAAHPARTRLSDTEILLLAECGLDGLEVYYPSHTEHQVAHLEELARDLGLLVTGGSDDHGDVNEGKLMGSVRLGWEHVERLHDAIDRWHDGTGRGR